MPTYNFRCKKCDKSEEVFQKHDDPFPQCEEHGEMTREMNGAPSIRKGAGLFSLNVGESIEKLGDMK